MSKNNVLGIPGKDSYTEEARLERLRFVSESMDAKLPILGQLTSFTPEHTKGRIENLVGSIEIPVGIAGPLKINGEDGEYTAFAPMATVEGTLIASTSRGARALMQSGGVTARVISQRIIRAPMFIFGSLDSSIRFTSWVKENDAMIKQAANTATRHGALKEIVPRVMGRIVHLNLMYDSGDAAGQNLSTKCTAMALMWIVKSIKEMGDIDLEESFIEGNTASDKKATQQSFISGRGTRVIAEGILKRQFIEEILNTTPHAMYVGYNRGVTGGIQSGMLGFNINVANVVAAIFAATGQDIASTHESGMGHFYVEQLDQGDIYVSLLLPSLVIGTVGGGTSLPGQRELLELNGCYGKGRVRKFAEIIASFCLSLDISTIAAVAANEFAAAHRKYG